MQEHTIKIAIYADDYTGGRGISVVGYEVLSRLLKEKKFGYHRNWEP